MNAKEYYKKVEEIFNKTNKDKNVFLSKWFFEFDDSFVFYSDNGDINKIDMKLYLVDKESGSIKSINEKELKDLSVKYGKPKRSMIQ